jgi:hypothetical protein
LTWWEDSLLFEARNLLDLRFGSTVQASPDVAGIGAVRRFQSREASAVHALWNKVREVVIHKLPCQLKGWRTLLLSAIVSAL